MVCDDESKGRLQLFSIIDWGKTRLKDCWTAILRSVSSLCSAATAMLCGVQARLKWMLCGVLWLVRLLVTAASLIVARVVSGGCHGVRRGLDRMLRRWRDKERIVQEVQDRGESEGSCNRWSFRISYWIFH